MHRDLTGQFQIVHPAFQIVTGGAQIAQFLRFLHLIGFRSCLYLGLFGRDEGAVQICQLGLARRDVKAQFVIEGQGLGIEDVQTCLLYTSRCV